MFSYKTNIREVSGLFVAGTCFHIIHWLFKKEGDQAFFQQKNTGNQYQQLEKYVKGKIGYKP